MKNGRDMVPNNTCTQIKITVFRSLDEVEAIRPIWEKMKCRPNADIDFYLTVMQSLPNVIRPHVILLRNREGASSLAVGRIERHRFTCDFGYKTVYSTMLRSFSLIHGGVLGNPSYEESRLLVKEIMNVLRRGEVDIVFLSNLNTESYVYQLATSIPRIFCRDIVPVVRPHWTMTIPDNIEDLFSRLSTKARHELRRYPRALEKQYPGKISYRVFSAIEDIDDLFTHAEEVAGKTYHRGLNVGFVDSPAEREILGLFARKGWLRAYMLYVDKHPSAFWIGRRYGETFYPGYTDYDPAYKKYELGTILFIKMIESLCEEKDVRLLDFGFGDAFYKNRFGDGKWLESSIYVFPFSLSGLSLNFAHTLTSLVYQVSVKSLQHFKLLEKVKKVWRSRFIKKKEVTPPADEQT